MLKSRIAIQETGGLRDWTRPANQFQFLMILEMGEESKIILELGTESLGLNLG
jgi:hypothetical protein